MKTLKRGDQGSDVVKLQNALYEHGYKVSKDGVFGPGTERVVKQFQSSERLTADGIVGKGTWAALASAAPVEPEPVSMEHIAAFLLPYQMEQQYKLSGAQCPSNPKGMSLKRIGTEYSNCVLFTAWLLSWAFAEVQFEYKDWKKWMNSGGVDTNQVPGYGPRVALEWGITKKVPEGAGPWLVQTFSRTGGHSYIVLDHEPETGKILCLESNAWINGAGWDEIGALRDVYNPGPNWAQKVSKTWESRVYGPNVAVHIVELKITGVKEWLAKGEK